MECINMKTGFAQEMPDMLDYMTIYTSFVEDALAVASKYCLHSGRQQITPKDISLGLKTRFKYSDHFNSNPNMLEKLLSIKNYISNNVEDVEDVVDNVVDNVEVVEDDHACIDDCTNCSMVNDTKLTWDSFIESKELSPLDKICLNAIQLSTSNI